MMLKRSLKLPMTEKLVAVLKVVKKPTGSYQVTIPKRKVATPLGLEGDEQVSVYFDADRRRWSYQLSR